MNSCHDLGDECDKVKALLVQISNLVSALEHMKVCGPCAMDPWDMCEGDRAALSAIEEGKRARITQCNHDWKDARNEVVQSGELCIKCGAIR